MAVEVNWPLLFGLGVFAVALIPMALRIWPQMWRGEFWPMRLDPTPRSWVWGAVLWHAWVRSWFIATWFGVVCLVGLPLAFLNSGPAWFGLFILAAFLGWGALSLSVVLTNRPSFCVPPVLREASGLVTELRAKRTEGTGD